MKSIYLDHNATTPMRSEVFEAMSHHYAQGYANPASQHRPGQLARHALEEAREGIADILGASLTDTEADRLIFTSGGTEANNLALLGLATRHNEKNGSTHEEDEPGQVIISSIEHASVIGPAEHLLERGWRLDTIAADSDGVVRAEHLETLLSNRTRAVSVMLANHETGVCQPVVACATICNEAGVPLHTDAIQVAGKLPIDFRSLGVAALSVTAHKFQGPLGIGALLLRHDASISGMLFGGHQQHGLRPGTESVPLAVGMWTALKYWKKEQDQLLQQLTTLRHRFESRLAAAWPELVVHGNAAERLPQTTNVAFPGIDGQILFTALDMAGVACSVGSACASGSSEISPTLLAIDLPPSLASSSLRFSCGHTTTEDDIDEAVRRIVRVCSDLCI